MDLLTLGADVADAICSIYPNGPKNVENATKYVNKILEGYWGKHIGHVDKNISPYDCKLNTLNLYIDADRYDPFGTRCAILKKDNAYKFCALVPEEKRNDNPYLLGLWQRSGPTLCIGGNVKLFTDFRTTATPDESLVNFKIDDVYKSWIFLNCDYTISKLFSELLNGNYNYEGLQNSNDISGWNTISKENFNYNASLYAFTIQTENPIETILQALNILWKRKINSFIPMTILIQVLLLKHKKRLLSYIHIWNTMLNHTDEKHAGVDFRYNFKKRGRCVPSNVARKNWTIRINMFKKQETEPKN